MRSSLSRGGRYKERVSRTSTSTPPRHNAKCSQPSSRHALAACREQAPDMGGPRAAGGAQETTSNSALCREPRTEGFTRPQSAVTSGSLNEKPRA